MRVRVQCAWGLHQAGRVERLYEVYTRAFPPEMFCAHAQISHPRTRFNNIHSATQCMQQPPREPRAECVCRFAGGSERAHVPINHNDLHHSHFTFISQGWAQIKPRRGSHTPMLKRSLRSAGVVKMCYALGHSVTAARGNLTDGGDVAINYSFASRCSPVFVLLSCTNARF